MQGKILNIWMSPDTGKKSHYGARTLGGIFGIAALTLLLISGGAVLTLSMGRHSAALSLYGSILLHEDVGGYVLVGVISFTAAVVMTVLCVKYRERKKEPSAKEDKRV